MGSAQVEVMAFLAESSTHHGLPVEVLETHASVVFLVGDRAFKLKRAVKYPYLDFSTEPARRAMCLAEVQVNRRTAPDIYRGVVSVTREPDGTLALGGTGVPVDWLVEMWRFDQHDLGDALAIRHALSLPMAADLASVIADFHRDAEQVFSHGGRAGMSWVVEGNAQAAAGEAGAHLDHRQLARVSAAARESLARVGAILDARREGGWVRRCHGDLHLGNVVWVDGRPTLFDAIEFNDELACVDVLYDLAFLLMDLWHRELLTHANVVWNRYLVRAGVLEGLSLLPLFLSCRAAIRAKTHATAAGMIADAARKAQSVENAAEYLRLAEALLAPSAPRLVAVGGSSGAGKSTVAAAIAAQVGIAPGAVVLRSDAVRKRLAGVMEETRLDQSAYAPAHTGRVYETMFDMAGRVLEQGYSVVLDASFLAPEHRRAVEAVARQHRVMCEGIWLQAPVEVLTARVTSRRGDASDADAAVVRQQLARYPGAGLEWQVVDASADPGTVERRVRTCLAR